MPFNSAGVYTCATGATTAVPGDLIKSSTWDAIFVDLAAALTLLGEQLYGSTAVSTTPYVPLAADTFLLVSVAGPVVINLPAQATRSGFPLRIKDTSGAASTNNITINRNGAETIEGLTSIVINTDYGGYSLFPVSGGWIIRP